MPITPSIIQTVLGNGQEGWSGDGGPALQAACETPYMCAFDTQGNMFVCMGQHHRIRRMDVKTGIITLVAGTGDSGYSGDGGPALHATFNMPYALTVDTNGDIYIAERGQSHRAQNRRPNGPASPPWQARVAEKGYSGDGGPATKAMLREPNDVYLDGKGGLLIADVQDQRIRRVDLRTGYISTYAGTGEKSRAGDGKRAVDASLMGPRAVCMDRLGNTYICEREGNGVRKVDAQGILTTIAGAEAVRGLYGGRRPGAGGHLGRAQGHALRPAQQHHRGGQRKQRRAPH